jgi:predicted transcriptional regulator
MATQQEFLRAAMSELRLTRDGFAARLACPKRTLDKWLLPGNSKDHRTMDEAMWKFVREVLEHERLKASIFVHKK